MEHSAHRRGRPSTAASDGSITSRRKSWRASLTVSSCSACFEYTITAWESEDAARQVMRSAAHKAAVKRFFTDDFGAALGTGVWRVHHLNPLWVRCSGCAQVIDRARDDVCPCGQPFPEPPSYW